jgi:hypothetical protein
MAISSFGLHGVHILSLSYAHNNYAQATINHTHIEGLQVKWKEEFQ